MEETVHTVAAGINNRKESAFINANRQQFPQGEAQNPNIITRAACDQLSALFPRCYRLSGVLCC